MCGVWNVPPHLHGLFASMTLLIFFVVAWTGLQKADGKWGLNRVHDTIKPNHRNRFKGMAQCVWVNRNAKICKSVRFDSACVHLCSLGRTVYRPMGHCQSAEHKNIKTCCVCDVRLRCINAHTHKHTDKLHKAYKEHTLVIFHPNL